MAKRRRKTRTHLKGPKNVAQSAAPKSFVIRSGAVSRNVGALVQDVRKVMEPNTASRLRERKSNKLRDFLSMCGPIGVSHLLLFSQRGARDIAKGPSGGADAARALRRQQKANEAIGNVNLRIARTPRGPTVTFRVNKFALARDVAKAQRRSRAPGGEYQTAPLLVLNNFGSAEPHVKLLVSVFQGLFPPIHVQSMHLSEARRIVLLNYNADTQTIDYRHYLISVRPVGVSRRVRRVIEGSSGGLARGGAKKIPNLSSANDISEYLMGRRAQNDDDDGASVGDAGFETDASSASEADSDVDDDGKPRSHVQLPSGYVGRGNVRDSQRAVRLRELGPRMELRCVKIEEGIPGAGKDGKSASGSNEVLWHDYVRKSNAETSKQRKTIQQREAERKLRRAQQESNVARKKAEKEANKKGKGAEKTDGNSAEEEEDEEEHALEEPEEDDDEFAYEDMHGADQADEDDEDELFDDEDDIDEDESVGDVSEEEDDDSDLSPIEIDDDQFDSDEDDASEDDRRTVKRPLKKTKQNGRNRR